MDDLPPPAIPYFVPFQKERLLQDDGRLLESVVQACAKAVSTLAATRTTFYVVKGKEVVDTLGRTRFKPLFQDRNADQLHMPSLRCSACGDPLNAVGVLCSVCKGMPVRLRAGPTLVDFAWEGSGESATMSESDGKALEQADQVLNFAISAVHFGKMLAHLSELAIVRGAEQGSCAGELISTQYPNVLLTRLELHTNDHFVYTVVLDKDGGEEMESVSMLLCKSIERDARQWLVAVDGTLGEVQNDGVITRLDEDDNRRLDRTCSDLAKLIAQRVTMQDSEKMRNRLTPECLEKKALCEFVRCSSKAIDQVQTDRDAMTRLLQAIAVFPAESLVGNLPSELTDFLHEGCPAELIATLPHTVSIASVPCMVFANFLVDALRKIDEWKPPSESSVCFPSTVVSCFEAPTGKRVIPAMEWCHLSVRWVVRRWSHAHRTGLDTAGVRIVRLIATVWGMHAAGAFEPGSIHANTLYTVGEAYAGRAAAVREWAVQVLQPTLLRANLVNAEALICNAVPEVEDELDECTSAFSTLALDEVLTLTHPESDMYRNNYWRIAELAVSMLPVRLPQAAYRDFVRVILPMAVAHLGEQRCRRGISMTARSNWIADILFREPAVLEIAKIKMAGDPLPPIIFLPNSTIVSQSGRNTLNWLSQHARRFVRHARVGTERVRGYEVVVQDLLRVMYPSA